MKNRRSYFLTASYILVLQFEAHHCVGSCAVCCITSVCFVIISVVSALCLVQHVIVTVGRKLDMWGNIFVEQCFMKWKMLVKLCDVEQDSFI